MYYYAVIELETGICYDIAEVEEPITDDPSCIEIGSYDKSYLFRKKYVDGVWVDTTPAEAQQFEGAHIGIHGEWLDIVIDGKADIAHTHDGYATADHSHAGYVSSDDLQVLEDVVGTKADVSHTHSEYANSTHTHDDYATQTALEALETEVDGKANVNHTHAEYASTSHTHSEYADIDHSHVEYVLQTSFDSVVDTLENEIDGKANTGHAHSEYVTSTIFNTLESEVDTKANAVDLTSHASDTELHITDAERNSWNAKSNFSGNYNDLTNKPNIPSVNGLASKDYVDEKVDAVTAESIGALPNTTVIPSVPTNISAFANDAGYLTEHQSLDGLATETYVDSQIDAIDIPDALSDLTTDTTHRLVTDAEKATWNAKSSFSGNYNDLTNKPSIPSISGLATETYVDEAVNDKANVGHNHNDDYYTETEVDSLLSAKANSSHTHSISNVSGLQNALDTKSPTTHNHNTSYDALGAANTALASAKEYADELIADEVANRDSAIATAKSSAISTASSDATTKANNALASAKTYTDEAIDTLSETVSAKANTSSLTSHTGNTSIHITATERTNWNAAKTHADSAHAPTTNATQTASGLMSKADKIKLDNIAENANNYILPSAGTSLGGVKSGGDVAISSGVITVNDDSHNHIISNVDGLQSALDSKAASGHNHDGVYYTETETDTLLEGKANVSHTHTISNITNLQNTLDSKANTSHGTHVSYSTTAPVMDGTASVGTAATVARSDHKHPTDTSRAAQTSLDSHTSNKSNPHGVTLAQLGVTATAAELNKMDGVTATTAELNYVDGVTSNIQTQLNSKASSSHTHSAATTSAAGLMSADDKAKLDGIASGANKYTLPTASSTLGGVKTTSTVTSNSGYTACPIIGGVPYYKDTNTTYNLGSFGVTATAAELNYVDGVTSNVQTQLNGKAASSHTHNYAGSSSAGGAATSANKLATARTISLTGDVTGSTSFDGSGNVSITATVVDDSHNHTIANVDGLQTALNGKSATSHNHNSAYVSKDLQFTGDNGGAIISYNRDDGKNILTEIAALPAGFYTIYSQSGTSGNPKTTEAWRFMVHKTGATAGWVQGYGSIGSVYTNYIDGTNGWRGWRCIWDNDPNPLWSGQYYMSSPNSTPQTVTPTKKLSECRTGWLLLWSDYDAGSGSNDSDFVTTIIPKNDPSGNKWGGKSFLCDIPRYVGSNAEDVDTERRIIKPIYVHDDCIKGSYQNDKDERNDVVLRAVYEI